jgi:non-ribosomal peptide synthase protein (TIGR01720 family)
LLTITAAFHAGEAGLDVSARQIMQHRTIAGLCQVFDQGPEADAGPALDAEQGIIVGEMPLTPAQLWWCETLAPTMARPALFNHPYYVELRRPVSAAHLAEAVRLLAAHHDALRLRFQHDGDGTWRQWHAPAADGVPFTSHDLSAMPADEQDLAMESIATDEQRALHLTDGPTCRVVHFRIGPWRPDRLLIVAHHLVTDAVSRGVLLSDLQSLCGQLGRGEQPRLPVKTTSYRTWAQRLVDVDGSAMAQAQAELPFWLAQVVEDGGTLPPDMPGGVTTLGSTDMIDVALSAADTAALHDVARRWRVSLRDLLVWGVAEAVAAHTTTTECLIATTGHGRENLFDDVDVSRTVGWFQVIYPVRVQSRTGQSVADSVAAVAEQLAQVPRNGIGYGLLRFSSPELEVRRRLGALPAPRIAVNYMGTFGFDEVSQAEELFDVCHAPYGPTEDESGSWPFDLDVVGTLTGGRLRIEVGYATSVYRRETAVRLLDDLQGRLHALFAADSDNRTQRSTNGRFG